MTALALTAACGNSPTPPADGGADAVDEPAQAVVTVIACEYGSPCAADAGAD